MTLPDFPGQWKPCNHYQPYHFTTTLTFTLTAVFLVSLGGLSLHYCFVQLFRKNNKIALKSTGMMWYFCRPGTTAVIINALKETTITWAIGD